MVWNGYTVDTSRQSEKKINQLRKSDFSFSLCNTHSHIHAHFCKHFPLIPVYLLMTAGMNRQHICWQAPFNLKVGFHISTAPTTSPIKTHKQMHTYTATQCKFSANKAAVHHMATVSLTRSSSCVTFFFFSQFLSVFFFSLSAQSSPSHLTDKKIVMTQCWCFTGTLHCGRD